MTSHVEHALTEDVSLVGAQCYVSVGGKPVIDVALGEARPQRAMQPDTINTLFCLTKPVVAAAALALAQQRGISIDEPMVRSSEALRAMSFRNDITMRNVLTHRAGMQRPTAAEVMFRPLAERVRLRHEAHIDDKARIGLDQHYSEFTGWNTLRTWIEDLTGTPLARYLRDSMFDPLGIDLHFAFDEAEWRAAEARFGVHYEYAAERWWPLLHEALRSACNDETISTIGGFGSARALGRFYEALQAVLNGSASEHLPSPDVAREMTVSAGPPQFDELMNRDASFGLGCMTEMYDALSSKRTGRTFGHSGLFGRSFAFCDLDADLVCVVVSNTFEVTRRHRSEWTARVIDAVFEDVEQR